MGDMTDMAMGFFKGLLIFTVAVLIIGAIGASIGYKIGYDKGIKECNDKTIRKQLGL